MKNDITKDKTRSGTIKVERGYALWLFGLPGAGKTTVSKALKKRLEELDVPVVLFDGDKTRQIVGEGIGRTVDDRILLTKRYSALTSYLSGSRVITILAAINHTNAQRSYAREGHLKGQFGLVWIDAKLETCMARDPKSLFAKAQKAITEGQSPNVVGLDIKFEEPLDCDVVINTDTESPEEATTKIVNFLIEVGSLRSITA